jgi:hypothetical protein
MLTQQLVTSHLLTRTGGRFSFNFILIFTEKKSTEKRFKGGDPPSQFLFNSDRSSVALSAWFFTNLCGPPLLLTWARQNYVNFFGAM